MVEIADYMRYHSASALDYNAMSVRKFYIHLENFKKVHKMEQRRQAELHGHKLK